MTFDEILTQVLELLQREGRVSYRALKRRFALDDEYLEDLKAEIVKAKRLAKDEDGEVLVWTGGTSVASDQLSVASSQPPALSTQHPDARPQTLDVRPSAGERRQLTVMFCDLVGSTALSGQLDPEELREVVREYQRVCAEVVSRFEGHLAKYLGDGVLVYFGYPVAHEDDAQRAVRAGLGIVEALQRLPHVEDKVPSPLVGEGQGEGAKVGTITTLTPHPNLPLQGGKEKIGALQHLRVRIGIHTGLVVAGEMGAGDTREPLAIVGETPNLAARLQENATPDTVVISAATRRLVQGFFTCQDLGPQALKGVSAPIEVYRVLGESEVQSRLAVAATAGLTPLVGREEEIGLLLQRWERVKDGTGQVVLLSGEPGIGKSRLVQVLKGRVVGEARTWLECHCSPYYRNTALYPVVDLLQRVLGFTREDSPEEKLRKIEAALEDRPTVRPPDGLNEVVPLFASLLSLPFPEGRYPPLTLTPQRQKQKTLEALIAWLLAEAEKQPLPFIVEDPHWADPSTLEFLSLLIDQVPTARVLTVLTFRPEFTPPWPSRSHMTQLTLTRLPRKQVEVMVEKVAGGKVLPPEVVQQIVTKTDGVPLFVEELTKTVVESGLRVEAQHAAPVLSLTIPATLHDSLMARLDRLGTAKEVAQLGATLGREFSSELIQAVSPLDEATLQQALAKLVAAEVLYQRGLQPQARYLFKHALIQDAAYQSLLKSTRQQYHQQIVQVLEEQFPETREAHPELLAHHCTEAGFLEQAIPYWQQAGQKATQRSANIEAIAHLTKGLELLKILPDTPERAQQELMLQVALSTPLMLTRGWAAPEVGRVHSRARELCRQIGETPQLFPILHGLWTFHFIRAELQTAQELGEQLLSLAQSTQDLALLLEAHRTLGESLYMRGELVPAQQHFEQGIALYDPYRHRSLAFLYGHDPGVSFLSFAALALWCLGYPDQALARSHEALALAQGLSHPFSLAYCLGNSVWFHQLRREGHATQERAEAQIALSSEQGFALWLGFGTAFQGWALAEQGQGEEGITQIRQGLAAYRATGAEGGRPYFLAFLAEAYGKVGQAAEGLTVLDEALSTGNRTEERMYEAELYRLKGELTLQKLSVARGQLSEKSKVNIPHHDVSVAEARTVGGAHPTGEDEAEGYFLKAIEVTRKQQAKSLELRAVTSLSRLWQQQGKKAEARQMLAEVYNWFTEGFDTADLQEAKALLETLE